MEQNRHHDAYINVWQGLVPPRIEIFSWLACKGKINTKENMAKLGIIPQHQNLCPLYSSSSKSANHLLLECSYSWKIWDWWSNIWDLSWCFPSTLLEAFQQWQISGFDPLFKKVWLATFYVIIWSLWKERNRRIFKDVQCSSDKICEMILIRLGWWIKGWSEPFLYSCENIVKNTHCLRFCHFSPKPPKSNLATSSLWSPPPSFYYKWNVDASFDPLLKSSAIGGVLRNDKG